ncbi:MAG: metallophosphoesterase [Clostridia bacterium]|nr:metallophosphoesterase [Clostridia bacterium]
MKKSVFLKIFAALLAILCLLSALVACKKEPTENTPGDGDTPNEETGFVPVLRFAMASDIHLVDSPCIRDEKLQKMFEDAYAYSDAHATYQELDAVFFAGDTVDRGTLLSMERFFTALATHAREETVTRACLGNHEFYHDAAKTVENFRAASGYNDDDSHLVLGGYHFILISPDQNGRGFGAEKKAWLATQLSIAAKDDPTGKRPIFVFQHQHVSDTVYGSANTWGIPDLYSVLSRYPQVINFSGHSHFPINDPRSVWQGSFTAFNSASLKGLEMDLIGVADEYIFPTDAEGGWSSTSSGRADGGQYYIVEIDAKNRILVQAFDIVTGTAVIEPILLEEVGDPTKFTYTSDRSYKEEKPAFAKDAEVKQLALSTVYAKFSFPRTANGTYVQNYRCEVYTAGKLVKTVYRLDCGFLFPAPETLSLPIVGLQANTQYEVKIIPVSAWGNEGDPLTFRFTTKDESTTENGKVFSIAFGEGNAAKDAISDQTLTVTGTPTTVYDEALQQYIGVFDGNSAYEYHGFSLFYEELADGLTFETYLRMDSKPESDYVNPFSNQQGGGYGFEYKSNGKMHFYINVDGTYYNVYTDLAVGEWVHLVGTFDGKELKLYVNGKTPAIVKAVSGTIKPPSAPYLSIGGDSEMGSSGKFATCAIRSANVYAQVLTAEQIAALYNSYK